MACAARVVFPADGEGLVWKWSLVTTWTDGGDFRSPCGMLLPPLRALLQDVDGEEEPLDVTVKNDVGIVLGGDIGVATDVVVGVGTGVGISVDVGGRVSVEMDVGGRFSVGMEFGVNVGGGVCVGTDVGPRVGVGSDAGVGVGVVVAVSTATPLLTEGIPSS